MDVETPNIFQTKLLKPQIYHLRDQNWTDPIFKEPKSN